MKVARPTFAFPIIVIDSFLRMTDADFVLKQCIELKQDYEPATIYTGQEKSDINVNARRNQVAYLKWRGQTKSETVPTLNILESAIWSTTCRALWREGGLIFDVVNYSTLQEATVSLYRDGDFYQRHHDTRRDWMCSRVVTIVYYVNERPKQFTGGDLIFWDGKRSLRIQPRHNRAVAFPSSAHHEVEKVRTRTNRWEGGRFSINYWLGFR